MTRGEKMLETLKAALTEGGAPDIAARLRIHPKYGDIDVTGPGATHPSEFAQKMMYNAGIIAYRQVGAVMPCFECWHAYSVLQSRDTSNCEHTGGSLFFPAWFREEAS